MIEKIEENIAMSNSARTFPVPLPEGFDVDELMSLVPSDMWEKDEKAAAVMALRRSGKFDEEGYLEKYPDIRESGMGAIEHYVEFGVYEGRISNSQLSYKEIDISVIIPVYNSEKYIGKCIESVFEQDYKNIEVICIDDGSTDDSPKLLEKYSKKYNQLRIIKQKNRYAGMARNIGILISRGRYIHFLDSDDWVERDIYTSTIEYIEKYNADVVIFSYFKFDNNESKKTPSKQLTKCEEIIDIKNHYGTLLRGAVVPWNKIYKKSFLEKNNIIFDNLIVANDRTFFFKLLKANPQIICTKACLLNYRINNYESLVGKKREDNFYCHFIAFDNIKDLFFSDIEMYEIILDQFLRDLLYFYEKAINQKRISSQIKQYFLKNKNYFLMSMKMRKKQSFLFYIRMISYSENAVPIIFSTDNKYAMYLSVAIMSLIDKSSNNFYNIFILYDDLSSENVKLLELLSTSNVHIYCIDISLHIKNYQLYTRAHYSLSMYYRILSPQLFSYYNKIIYLDCDILLRQDIKGLFNIDIGDNYIGAVTNLLNPDMEKYVKYKLNMKFPQYINSGVLIINTKKWNSDDISKKCFQLIEKNRDFVCPDQDIINIICKNKISYLDLKWNFAWQHMVLDSQLSQEQQKIFTDTITEAAIIHYTSGVKPWKIDKNRNLFTQLWWKYARKSLFYDKIVAKGYSQHTI